MQNNNMQCNLGTFKIDRTTQNWSQTCRSNKQPKKRVLNNIHTDTQEAKHREFTTKGKEMQTFELFSLFVLVNGKHSLFAN